MKTETTTDDIHVNNNDKESQKERRRRKHLFAFYIVAVVNMSFVKWSIHQDESRLPIAIYTHIATDRAWSSNGSLDTIFSRMLSSVF